MSKYIKGLITGFDFDLNKLVSQGYDGASVMSGNCTGVQTRVRQFTPHAVYIHCYAHVLNLVLVDSIKSVKSAYEFFTLLEVLYVFMSTSKVHVIFIEKQQQLNPNRQHMELQKLSDTCWICHYAAVNAVCRTFDAILLTIEEVAESTDASKVIEARGLYNQVKSFSFLISLITFDKILICTKQLSEQLQSSTVDLSHASELVLATMSLLNEYRTNDYWERIYTYTSEIAKLHEIDSHTFDIERRQRKRPAHLNDSILLKSVGNREPLSTFQDLKNHLYFPVLEKFIAEMKRFDNKNLVMKGVSSCSPSSSTFLSLHELEEFAEAYNVDNASLEVECSLVKRALSLFSCEVSSLAEFGYYLFSRQPSYETLRELVQIALTIAVTSAEGERSFSALKRVKTRLRSTMTEDRLSNLSVLSIEKELAQAIDLTDIIDKFDAKDKKQTDYFALMIYYKH